MSWSRSGSGKPDDVVKGFENTAVEIRKQDDQYNTSEPIKMAHEAQIANAVEMTKAFAKRVPEGYNMSASISGYAGDANGKLTTDNCSVSFSMFIPAPPVGA
jgi:hypothetical protein